MTLGIEQDSPHRALQTKSLPRETLQHELLQRVRQLDVNRFESLIARLLYTMGYTHVQVLRPSQRARLSHKGRNRHGGMDLLARSRTGVTESLIAVQVKQYERAVARYFVDALRGAMVRVEAPHGMIVTTSSFSRPALRTARDDQLLPIQLVDGESLLTLMFQHHIGVLPISLVSDQTGSGKTETAWCIDNEYFEHLSSLSSPVGRRDGKRLQRQKQREATVSQRESPEWLRGWLLAFLYWNQHVTEGMHQRCGLNRLTTSDESENHNSNQEVA
jgi:hypothetical protein